MGANEVFASDLLGKFRDTHTRLSPEKRAFYGYPTSVVNTEGTQKTLASSQLSLTAFRLPIADGVFPSVRDSVLFGALKDADMIE